MEIIAGHKVQIATIDNGESLGHRFNHVIVASFLGRRLTMIIDCRTESDDDKAVRIFRSVKFKGN